jgi:hypothetical protein
MPNHEEPAALGPARRLGRRIAVTFLLTLAHGKNMPEYRLATGAMVCVEDVVKDIVAKYGLSKTVRRSGLYTLK